MRPRCRWYPFVVAVLFLVVGCSAHRLGREADGGDEVIEEDLPDASPDAEAPLDDVPVADLRVHEWGVFVDNRVHYSGDTLGEATFRRQVLYFYTDEALTTELNLSVDEGRVTESWPETALGERVSWPRLEIQAGDCPSYSSFPRPGQGQCDDPESVACAATTLETYVVPGASCVGHDGVRAPLLFYSGAAATSPLPLDGYFSVTMSDDPETPIEVRSFNRNRGNHATGPVFLIYRHLDGDCSETTGLCHVDRARVGATRLDAIEARGDVVTNIETEMLLPSPRDGVIEPPESFASVQHELESALTDSGLSEAEVDVLLEGWRHVLFDVAPSGHVIAVPMGISLAAVYVVPTEMYDEILPLTMTPRPSERVRVGLGFQFVEPGECNGCDLDDVPECS